jgi:hypothetical protein
MTETSQVAQSLSALLNQVRKEETEHLGANKQTLLAIAEYVLGNYSYSKAEYNQAVAYLAKYHLWKLIDKRKPIRSRQLIESERARPYTQRCANCGLPISSEKSLKTGLGRVCRKKLSPRTHKERV